MGLGSLFRRKKPKPTTIPSEGKEETSEKETNAPPPENSEDAPKLHSANIIPTPLAIDASVYTDNQNVVETKFESKIERFPNIEDKGINGSKVDATEKEDGIKSKSPPAIGVCDSKSCTKENCGPETCEIAFKKQKVSGEKIISNQLTEIINTTIKEAMETIVQQSRMEKNKDTEQNPKKELRKSVGYANKEEISMKAKQFNQSRLLKNLSKKPRDESEKNHARKNAVVKKRGEPGNMKTDNRRMTGNVNIYICSEATENPQASVKQKKPSPCMETSSETTTNQSNGSSCKLVKCIRKKRRNCKECNSLDSLTKRKESSDNSNDCSCPFKYTESDSTTKLESNDFINVSNASDDIVSEVDTESTLIECQCKDLETSNSNVTASKSNSSILRSKFVICDKLEPCAMIYPSKILTSTDSEKWSSKSICNSMKRSSYSQSSESDQDVALRDENIKDSWSLEPKSVPCNYYAKNYGRDCNICEDKNYKMHSKRNFVKICKCHKRDEESVVNCNAPSSYKSNRLRTIEKPDSPQSRLICSCIVEEEEDDATDCKKALENLRKQPIQFVPCRGRITNLKDEERETEKPATSTVTSEKNEKDKPEQEPVEKETVESSEKSPVDAGKATDSNEQETAKQGVDSSRQTATVKPFTSRRLIRPEARMLQRLLAKQEQGQQLNMEAIELEKPTVINVDAPKVSTKDTNERQPEKNKEPAFLKKFNLPKTYKWPMQSADEEEKEIVPEETEQKELENANIEETEDESEETKETTYVTVKQSPLLNVFKKILHRKEQSKAEHQKLQEDKTVENTLADKDNTDALSESENDANSSPQKTKGNKKKTVKKKDNKSLKSDAQKANKKTDETKVNAEVSDNKPANKKNEKLISNGDNGTTNNINEEKKQEKTSDSGKESQSKSKLLASIISKKLIPSSKQGTNSESTKLKQSQGLLKESETEEHNEQPKIQEPAKTEIEEKSHDQKEKEAESAKASGQAETMSRKATDTKRYPAIDERTMCAECCRRKSLIKMPKQPMDFYTVCTNPKFSKCSSINNSFIPSNARLEKDRCICCCLPPSECNDDFLNYPKSCLKKENPSNCVDWQENNLMSYHDNRSWEECGCRKVIACNGCCRPRNECSCRVPIICSNCCKPNLECNCKKFHKRRDSHRRMKSMFCLYCDKPQEKCTCRGPIEKCSCCELSLDLCACGDRKTFCTGRPVLTEPNNDHTMYVTAWKPREEVRRYFSRNLENRCVDSIPDCCCHKLMPHKSDDLPYQRLRVFSDVMDELQQKMSESSCCTQCRKTPCCCNIKIDKEKGRDERKKKYCVSPKSRRKIVAVCMEQVKDKSPTFRCKCDSSQTKNEKPMKIIVPLCCVCGASPCRCKRSKSSQKKPKPKAKCYYCKTSPCACITSREHSKSRPCRCADSPCRAKEKEIIPCGKISTKPKNNEEKTICVH